MSRQDVLDFRTKVTTLLRQLPVDLRLIVADTGVTAHFVEADDLLLQQPPKTAPAGHPQIAHLDPLDKARESLYVALFLMTSSAQDFLRLLVNRLRAAAELNPAEGNASILARYHQLSDDALRRLKHVQDTQLVYSPALAALMIKDLQDVIPALQNIQQQYASILVNISRPPSIKEIIKRSEIFLILVALATVFAQIYFCSCSLR